jgi:hypothetical protein
VGSGTKVHFWHFLRMATTTSTRRRVPAHSSARANRRIRQRTDDRVGSLAGHPARITARLRELDREWDVERAIEANAASLALAGLALGLLHDRRWITLPVLVAGFLLQHAVQGWCPPVPVLRTLRFRTADEVNEERVALRTLRGDFRGLHDNPERALQVARSRG